MIKLEPGVQALSCSMPCLTEHGNAGACPLLEAAQAAAQAIDETELRCPELAGTEALLEPRMLLAGITYCYARHIFGSAMLDLWARDGNLLLLCRNVVPGPDLLARFARENLQAIEQCLASLLRSIAAQRMAQGFVTRVNIPALAEEARRRLTMAAFTESVEAGADRLAEKPMRRGHEGSKQPVDDNSDTTFCFAG